MSYPYSIPAIETFYRGCRFRSRLEARWAVFFQTLGLSWEYEPEGFTLSTKVPYLPDFLVHLKDKPLWAEVKPTGVSADLFVQFIEDLKDSHGTILREILASEDVQNCVARDERECFCGGYWDNGYQFCLCETCGAIGFEFDGRSARIGCGCNRHGRTKDYTYAHPKILAAYTAARSARF
jgi:hypothetical protein